MHKKNPVVYKLNWPLLFIFKPAQYLGKLIYIIILINTIIAIFTIASIIVKLFSFLFVTVSIKEPPCIIDKMHKLEVKIVD
jgi:hypothetical protein